MSELINKVDQFATLSEYSLKQRVLIRLTDVVFWLAIRALGGSTRYEVRGMEYLEAVETAGKLPIICFWHDRILLGTYFFRGRGIVVLTSKSFDGEYIARFIQRFGYGAIRGSSSRGGAKALARMIKEMRAGRSMAFTVDGPRGPRYEAKPGPVILAKKTGNPIVPFVVEPKRLWTVNSWDKLQIPYPFSSALLVIGEPIYVGDDASNDEVDARLAELQASLDDLVAVGKRWSGRDD